MIVDLLISAVVFGVAIAVMKGDFPGLGAIVACVLAMRVPGILVNTALPPEYSIAGLIAGAICTAFVMSAMCQMTLKRSTVAVAIYLLVRVVTSKLLQLLS